MSSELRELIAIVFMFIGVFFMLVSAVGVFRMPDLFMRMSAATKSSTVGVSFVLVAAAFYFGHDLGSISRIAATILFLFITAPAAAHMIGRAGYYSGAPLWEKTSVDDLETRHDAELIPLRRARRAEDRINVMLENGEIAITESDAATPDGDDFD